MHLKHVAIQVRNLEASIHFYESFAELTVARRFAAGAGEIAFLTNGEGQTEIELIAMPEGRKYEGAGLFLCFFSDKLDERHAKAVDQGLKPSPIQNPGDGSRYFYAYDPDGVSVQLRSWGALR